MPNPFAKAAGPEQKPAAGMTEKAWFKWLLILTRLLGMMLAIVIIGKIGVWMWNLIPIP